MLSVLLFLIFGVKDTDHILRVRVCHIATDKETGVSQTKLIVLK